MKNIKIIKAILSITVFLLGAYSLLTKNFAYQNLSMFCAGLLVITIGIEESKKGKNRGWTLLSFAAAIMLGLALIHSAILFFTS